jgi:hypothetical protein
MQSTTKIKFHAVLFVSGVYLDVYDDMDFMDIRGATRQWIGDGYVSLALSYLVDGPYDAQSGQSSWTEATRRDIKRLLRSWGFVRDFLKE